MSTRRAFRVLVRAAPLLRPHLDTLVEQTVDRVAGTITFYRDTTVISRDELRTFARDNFEHIIGHDPERGRPLRSPPRELGRAHAEHGAPLADLLSAYKVGFALLWETIARELVSVGAVASADVADMATALFWRAAEFGEEIVEGHRDATTEILLRHEHERSAMVEALVTGTLVEQPAIWETASRLDIPYNGHFLVAVAAAEALGGDPLPGITKSLGQIKVASAWRLSPHQAVGVLSLRDPDPVPVVERLEACSTGRVGISPIFTSLDSVPRAFYLAGIALRSTPPRDVKVRQFDDAPLAVLVAAAPDAAGAIMRNVLGRFLDQPVRDQETLLETYEMWLRCGGSATDTAAHLYCHPNTVRHRLHRLTEWTGRSMDDPASIGELSAALYTWRLIGEHVQPLV
ncbi:MAG TPA: helix-turn-helix domain-containing protein [Pseudonocardia sp.]|nr:helix-turn-helix domain-containing protein [Pseudonocardia sp.]